MTARLQEQSDRRMRDNQTQPGHVPVLLDQVIDYLSPAPGKTFIDATFGGGGHAAAILEASAPDGRLLAIDADPDAVARARRLAERYPGRLEARQGSFAHLRAIAAGAGFAAVDGVLMDLGVSSYQLDTPARGFSFRFPAPLDMRFDPTAGEPASTLVNTLPEEDLARLLYELGEEPKARRIARAIVEARADQPIETTDRLAAIVERAAGGRRGRHIHPATKTFQALRMAVNRELDALQAGLADALALLTPGGRLVVISFHSLEDRMVKTFFRREARDCVCPPGTPVCTCGHRRQLRILTAKPVRPDAAEQARNPRSRSARLRAAERLS